MMMEGTVMSLVPVIGKEENKPMISPLNRYQGSAGMVVGALFNKDCVFFGKIFLARLGVASTETERRKNLDVK
jgi:hypothetical protein